MDQAGEVEFQAANAKTSAHLRVKGRYVINVNSSLLLLVKKNCTWYLRFPNIMFAFY